MTSIITSQQDYILFLHGLGLLVLHATCILLVGVANDRRLPWRWLSRFALLLGLGEWTAILSMEPISSPIAGGISVALRLSSTVMLAVFAWEALRDTTRALGAYASLLVLAALGSGVALWMGIGPQQTWALTLAPASVAGAVAALWRADTTGGDRRDPLLVGAAVALAVHCGATLVTAGHTLAGMAALSKAHPLWSTAYAIGPIASIALAILVLSYYTVSTRCRMPLATGHRSRRAESAMAAALVIVALGGWVLTEEMSRRADGFQRDSLRQRVSSAAACIDPDLVGALKAVPSSEKQASYRRVVASLRSVRAANPESRFVYLVVGQRQKAVFLADAEPPSSAGYSAPGDAYTGAPRQLLDALPSRRALVIGPFTDSWGTWVSAFAPVRSANATQGPVMLGIDIDARLWARDVAGNRQVAIAITLLASAMVMVLMVSASANRAATQRAIDSERELQHRAGFLQVLLDAIPVPVFYKDKDGAYLGCNKACAEATGLATEDVVGKSVSDLAPPEHAEALKAVDDRLLQTGGQIRYESAVRYADGTMHDVILHKAVVPGVDGSPSGLVGTALDVTEIKRGEERLRKLNECLLSFGPDTQDNINRLTALCGELLGASCAFYNRLRDGMLCSDGCWNTPADFSPADKPDGRICFDVIRQGPRDVVVLRDLQNSRYAIDDPTVTRYGLQTYVGRVVRLVGEPVGSLCAVFTEDRDTSEDDKRVIEIAASAIETEEARRAAEDALRLERDKLEAVTDSMGAGMTLISPDYRILWTNGVMRNRFGDVQGQKCHAVYRTQPGVCEGCGAKLVFETGVEHVVIEQNGVEGDGEEAWFQIVVTPVRDAQGSITAALEIVVPITERKKMEEALRENEARYHTLFENSAEGILVLTDTILDCNERACHLYGCERDQMIGRSPAELSPPEQPDGRPSEDAAREYIEAALSGTPQFFHWQHSRNDGSLIDTEVGLNAVTLNGRRVLQATVRDVTERRAAEEAIRSSEERFRSLFSSMNEGCALHEIVRDPEGRAVDYTIIDVNAAYARIVGVRREDVCGRSATAVYGTPVAPYLDLYASIAETGEPASFEVYFEPMNRHFHVSAFSPRAGAFATVFEDITDRKTSEEAMRSQISAMNAASDQILIANARGEVVFANSAFMEERGCSESDVIGGPIHRWLESGHGSGPSSDEIWMAVARHGTWQGEISRGLEDGSSRIEDITLTAVCDSSGEIENVIAIKRNVTEKKAYEERLDHLAHHDPLTGLPNRLLFSDRLNHSLSRAKRHDTMVAVMFLDLDGFKLINDTLGHNAGDILLWQVAGRLTKRLRGVDTIARMGGDEFTIVLTDVESAEVAASVAERVLSLFAEPFTLAGRELFVSTSVGISVYPEDGADVETLVRNADAAMYRAKEQGKNSFCLYTESLNASALEQMTLLNSLRKALQTGEFALHYQPRVDIESGRVLGVEALIRWHSPELGWISPAQFIPLAEEAGLIGRISEWVLRTACKQNKAWQDAGLPEMDVAVNISARELEDHGLVRLVEGLLDETGLHPSCLGLEVTEGTLMRNPELSAEILHSLKRMGVKISIDDFGTGHSSLSKLKRLPIDTVKIDQSFVKDITTNADDTAIAAAVVAMAHSLKLNVLAEGVETLEQLEMLRSLGCDEVQGYFISKPLPADELIETLSESQDRGRQRNREAA